MTAFNVTTRVLAAVGFATTVGSLAAAAFFLGGFYDVSAHAKDPGLVDFALVRVRTASIVRHASVQPTAPPDDVMQIRAGAQAYLRLGCVNCHGAPGIRPASFSEGLNPPPNLKRVINQLSPEETLWVIQNGIRMTGMPAFGFPKTPPMLQEQWSVVAFLKHLEGVTPKEFAEWTEGQPPK